MRQITGRHIVNPYARVHILSEIAEEKCTAICAKCGPVRIEWDPSQSPTDWEPGAIPGSAAPGPIDKRLQENTRVVTEYKRRQACKRCGSMAVVDPGGFGFFEMHLPKQQRISYLVYEAEPGALAAELEKRDMYCKKCLRLVKNAFANNTPVPEFQPFPVFF